MAAAISGRREFACDPLVDFQIAITYQVLDQTGSSLPSAKMQPQEQITNFVFNGVPNSFTQPISKLWSGTRYLVRMNNWSIQVTDQRHGAITNGSDVQITF